MWLNIWPLVKSRIMIRLMAAHKFLFRITGRIYGDATLRKVMTPSTEVVRAIIRM